MTVSDTPKARDTQQAVLDDALDDTFPASDPPSQTDPTHGVLTGSTPPSEDAVRARAYDIWLRDGAHHGRHAEHWDQAREELESVAGGVKSAT
jgi:hypothetical protein